MNLLKFKLISNNKVEIEEETSYFINNDSINFKIGDTLYKYNLEDDILIKSDSNLILTIDPENNIIYVKLVENNMEFDMTIAKTKVIKKDHEIEIKYTVIGDENIENVISIKF